MQLDLSYVDQHRCRHNTPVRWSRALPGADTQMSCQSSSSLSNPTKEDQFRGEMMPSSSFFCKESRCFESSLVKRCTPGLGMLHCTCDPEGCGNWAWQMVEQYPPCFSRG